jgi:threonine synthase
VLCITGNGLKTLDAISGSIEDSPIVSPKVREVAALVAASA